MLTRRMKGLEPMDWLEDFFNDFVPRYEGRREPADWVPRVDVRESDNAWVLDLELPGMKKDGIDIANGTIYGLTGSLLSRDRERIAYAKRHYHVGNLYFNRKCTGALVGSQPFGGFNMSGTDSKAGGLDYLLLFSQAKTWSERL